MKHFVLLLAFLACSVASPTWYGTLQKENASTYIGYGSAQSEAQAKQEALNDIASQISVNIESSLSQNIKEVDGKVSRVSEDAMKQSAQATLGDYTLLKVERSDGNYFVALSYENVHSLDKFVRKVKLKGAVETAHPSGYLRNTSMARELQKALGKEIDFSLLRKDAKWFIKHEEILQALDKKDFAKFFVSVPHATLTINTNKKNNILHDGETFHFEVSSDNGGFVSIVSVYEDGTVSTLVRNIPVKKETKEKIPDANFETMPEAGLMQKGVETYDLYVLIYSQTKLSFESFAYADSELISEEKYKNFDELIAFLEGKTYTTLKVVTKPR